MSTTTLNNEQISKILWHPLMYRLLKGVLVPVGIGVHNELYASHESPRIDTVLICDDKQWTASQRDVLPDGIRSRDCQHHILEFKITQSITKKALKQALVYDYTYPDNHNLEEHEYQTYVIGSKTPLQANRDAWGFTEGDHPGVYTSTMPAYEDIVLIALNKLRPSPHNSYFQLFSSDKKVRERAFEYVLKKHAHELPDDLAISQLLTVIFAIAQSVLQSLANQTSFHFHAHLKITLK